MTRAVPAVTTAVLAATVALGALAGPVLLAAALLVTVIVMATGWPTLLGLPTQRGSTTVLALGGTAAVLVVTLAGTDDEPLRWLTPLLALSVVATFAHQLLRRDMRPRLVESVAGVVSGVVVVELVAGWIAAAGTSTDLVLAGVAALVPASLALAIPLPQRVTGTLCVVAALVGAVVASVLLDDLATVPGAVTGLLVAVLLVSLDRLFATLPSATSRQAGLALGAAGVCCSGAIVYLLERVAG